MAVRKGMWVLVAKGIPMEYRVQTGTGRTLVVLSAAKTPVDLDLALGIALDQGESGWVVVLQKPTGLTKRRPAWDESRMVDDAYLCQTADLAQASVADIPKARMVGADTKRLRALGYQ